MKDYYQQNKDKAYWRNVKNKYGLSKDGYIEFFDKQNGGCALCEKPFIGLRDTNLHVDHSHETGKVRGLLCLPCNVALGMLGDNEAGLQRALEYVKEN